MKNKSPKRDVTPFSKSEKAEIEIKKIYSIFSTDLENSKVKSKLKRKNVKRKNNNSRKSNLTTESRKLRISTTNRGYIPKHQQSFNNYIWLRVNNIANDTSSHHNSYWSRVVKRISKKLKQSASVDERYDQSLDTQSDGMVFWMFSEFL